MEYVYDLKKAEKLLRERSIDIKEIVKMLLAGTYIKIIKNPNRPGQRIYILKYNGYIHIVPFVVDVEGKYVLKTAYASRKYNKMYGGSHEDKL